MKKCNNCGFSSDNDYKYCPACGQEILYAESATEIPVASTTAKSSTELARKKQQTEFFNKVAGVDDREDDISDQYYIRKDDGVPFEDDDVVDFNVASVRSHLNQSTRKNIKIGFFSSAALALVIAAMFVVNIFHPLFVKAASVPMVYLKGNGVWMTSDDGTMPCSINYSDSASSIINEKYQVERVKFTSDYNTMLVAENYKSVDNSYTLFERDTYGTDWRNDQTNGTQIDTKVYGHFDFFLDESAILYRKIVGGEYDLFLHTIDGGNSLVAKSVSEFTVLSESSFVYMTSRGGLVIADYSSGALETNTIDTNVSEFFAQKGGKCIFYLSYAIENGSFTLNIFDGEKKTQVAKSVESAHCFNYNTGACYYTKNSVKKEKVSDIVTDDMQEGDKEYPNTIYAKFRYSVRESGVFDQYLTRAVLSLAYFDGKKETVINDEIAEVQCGYGGDDLAVLYLACGIDEKISFHQYDSYIYMSYRYNSTDENDSVEFFKSITQRLQSEKIKSKGYKISRNSKNYNTDIESINMVSFSEDKSSLLYRQVNSLKRIDIGQDDNLKSTEICSKAEDFLFTADKKMLYTDSDKNLYLDKEKIAQNTEKLLVMDDGITICAIVDYNSQTDCGSLIVYKDGEVTNLADKVNNFVFGGDGMVIFIGEYNSVDKLGDLYYSEDLSSVKLADTSAYNLVDYCGSYIGNTLNTKSTI